MSPDIILQWCVQALLNAIVLGAVGRYLLYTYKRDRSQWLQKLEQQTEGDRYAQSKEGRR